MIIINIDKAKAITHDRRRTARAAEFAPHDDVMKAAAIGIPGMNTEAAEAARQAIRIRHEVIQMRVDMADSPEALKAIIEGEGL